MKKIHNFCLCFALFFAFATAIRKGKCSAPGKKCSDKKACSPISNGKSYCNLNTNRCEAIRYCDESSIKDCPFNDLSADESKDVVRLIKKKLGSKILFAIVRQQEPNKKEWNLNEKSAKERMAYAAVFDLVSNCLKEVLVSLTKQRVISVKKRRDSVSVMTKSDYLIGKELMAKDPRVKYAYERRGLNASNAAFDVWSFGAHEGGKWPGRRQVRVVCNYKDNNTMLMDWCPVEGVIATIDIAEKKIIGFIDKGNIPVPKAHFKPDTYKFNESVKASDNSELSKTIKITGNLVQWQTWKFQFSMDPIYGLTFYHVRNVADCEERLLIYKLCLSEMFIPYGSHGETWRWRGAFDAGEYGIGKSVVPFTKGREAPAHAKLLSCLEVVEATGEVKVTENCIAIYERNVSMLYKHTEVKQKINYGVAGTQLVVTFMSTVGNYDYIFENIFSMDGSIDITVIATGIVLTKAVERKMNDPECVEDCEDFINEHTIGPCHQHFFNYRIDFDIDGTSNLLTENDFTNVPVGPENPDGGAFRLKRTVIRKETFRDSSPMNARFWSVINTNSRNNFNTPRGYAVHPTNAGHTFLLPGKPLDEAQFIKHPVWVTAYNDDEQGAAGDFPRSGKPGQGLPDYVKKPKRLCSNTDLVFWYTFVVNHATRPEEFPIMDKMYSGFRLMPHNFMSGNPNIVKCPIST